GRQGDPGESRFYISLEDDLMRLFASEAIAKVMDKLGMEEDEPIEHTLITRSIEHAQKKVEARNFDIRKHVLEYDDVMNQQREIMYGERKKILRGENLRENISGMVNHIIKQELNQYANEKLYPEEWQLDELIKDAEKIFAPPGMLKVSELEKLSRDELKERLETLAADVYRQREEIFTAPVMRELEKVVMLRIVDNKWMEHLDHMDMLREGINLRAYGQRSPLVEYKIEALAMFEEMEGAIQDQIASTMYHVAVVQNEAPPSEQPARVHQTAEPAQVEQADEQPARVYQTAEPAQVEQADEQPARVYQTAEPAQVEQADEQPARVYQTAEPPPVEKLQIRAREAEAAVRREQAKVEDRLQTARASHGGETSPAESKKRARGADGKKIGRNDPCPCGSGKKYKNCCGRNR
ncbi:MAG: SEC-C domain-containing protein, partial [Selenomonadaceae bacterium]|nr:SEC-C domain-containing protein [Selenomonadaceae bacterium]